jgi:hypothetical protein
MNKQNLSNEYASATADIARHEAEKMIRDLLTLEKPVLYIGSSLRWGWNDSDPARKSLLARFQKTIPGMDLVHVPDRKSGDAQEYSSGISVFAGVPFSRLETIMNYFNALENRQGRILIFHDHETPLVADHVLDARNFRNVELLLEIAEDLLNSGDLIPWGMTPEGQAHQELQQKKLESQRRTWTWDETKEINIPEEFRHELAAGLDENAE